MYGPGLLSKPVLGCSHVAGASGEAWKQGNVDFTGVDITSLFQSIPVAYQLLLPLSLAMLKPGRLLLCLLRMVCMGSTGLMGMQNYTLPPRLCLFSPLERNL